MRAKNRLSLIADANYNNHKQMLIKCFNAEVKEVKKLVVVWRNIPRNVHVIACT